MSKTEEVQITKQQSIQAKQFLSENIVSIVDGSSASRTRLANTIIGMGANPQRIRLHSTFEDALDCFRQEKPKIVLSEFFLRQKSGFDLFHEYRNLLPDRKDSFFVLITSNSSESAVARAAEEDIDTYIVKPYTLQTLNQSIFNALVKKLFPSQYIRTVEAGKKLLFDGYPGKARDVFIEATKLNAAPTLAYFYLGQAESMLEAMEKAKGDYQTGLNYNEIHYKCLVGLYDVFMKQNQFQDAYQVVRKVAKYFPANPKRLASVVRLAIQTGNLYDLEEYYEIYTALDTHTEELTKHMCAGLIVVGRSFLKNNDKVRGVKYLNAAAVSCAGKTGTLCAIAEAYIRHKMPQEAEEVIKRVQAGDQNTPEVRALRYLLNDLSLPAARSVEEGRKLVRDGCRFASIYLTLGRRLIEIGLNVEAVSLMEEAFDHLPNDRKAIEDFLWTLLPAGGK